MTAEPDIDVAIVGGGFSGLAAAYELAKAGRRVKVFEAGRDIGGLASAFEVEGQTLDRFYHHWFTNDRDAMALIEELGLSDMVKINPTNTGMYFANRIFRLASPKDLLQFSALPFHDRIRLGLLALRARRVSDWKRLEGLSAAEWLTSLGGKSVYEVVWEPLLKGKFGPYAEDISAVWFWNKLKLRGSSRGKSGQEQLAYFDGGFVALANRVAEDIAWKGGDISLKDGVTDISPEGEGWRILSDKGTTWARRVVATPALPLVADMVKGWADASYVASLRRIAYLANVCLVLQLDRSLSDTYWLNVNDPSFPYVGVIEHTNFEPASTYGGRHIVYLSKYLPHTDEMFGMEEDEVLDFALPHLERMFPEFKREWILGHNVWKSRWSQPVVERNYSELIPAADGPRPGFHLCSMAQIYPEDRGTNYAIREGRKIGRRIADEMGAVPNESTTRLSA
ncbi:MAG: NAD(P)/FAD-dependent oxidoreductase [Pseudomonadota bacterium]